MLVGPHRRTQIHGEAARGGVVHRHHQGRLLHHPHRPGEVDAILPGIAHRAVRDLALLGAFLHRGIFGDCAGGFAGDFLVNFPGDFRRDFLGNFRRDFLAALLDRRGVYEGRLVLQRQRRRVVGGGVVLGGVVGIIGAAALGAAAFGAASFGGAVFSTSVFAAVVRGFALVFVRIFRLAFLRGLRFGGAGFAGAGFGGAGGFGHAAVRLLRLRGRLRRQFRLRLGGRFLRNDGLFRFHGQIACRHTQEGILDLIFTQHGDVKAAVVLHPEVGEAALVIGDALGEIVGFLILLELPIGRVVIHFAGHIVDGAADDRHRQQQRQRAVEFLSDRCFRFHGFLLFLTYMIYV